MGVRGSSDATVTIWVRVAPSSFYSHGAMHCGADVGNEGPSTVHYNSRCIMGYFESTTLGCSDAHYIFGHYFKMADPPCSALYRE